MTIYTIIKCRGKCGSTFAEPKGKHKRWCACGGKRDLIDVDTSSTVYRMRAAHGGPDDGAHPGD